MNLKDLRYIKATVSFTQTLKKGTGSRIFNDAGQVIDIAGGKYSSTLDKYEYTTLRIRSEDADFAFDALKFTCIDDINFTFVPKGTGPVLTVEVPGRFSPSIDNENVISEIVETFQLLGDHYQKYQDIFNPKNDIKFLVPAVTYLISKANGEDAELEPWVSHILKIKKENNHE